MVFELELGSACFFTLLWPSFWKKNTGNNLCLDVVGQLEIYGKHT